MSIALASVVAANPARQSLSLFTDSAKSYAAAVKIPIADFAGVAIDATAGTITGTVDSGNAALNNKNATSAQAAASLPTATLDLSVAGFVTLKFADSAATVPISQFTSAIHAIDSGGGTKQLLAIVSVNVSN